nr:ankyrin repeat-containing protein [Tanacetum cinerariifolium]
MGDMDVQRHDNDGKTMMDVSESTSNRECVSTSDNILPKVVMERSRSNATKEIINEDNPLSESMISVDYHSKEQPQVDSLTKVVPQTITKAIDDSLHVLHSIFMNSLLTNQEETSDRFDRMQESIDKNKANAELLKALQPHTTLPAIVPPPISYPATLPPHQTINQPPPSNPLTLSIKRIFDMQGLATYGERLKAAMMCLEGPALSWFRWSDNREPESGTARDYITIFEKMVAQLPRLPEEVLEGIFLKGLKQELRTAVRTQKPTGLSQSMELALIIDETRWAPFKRMTDSEFAYKKAKGLCYRCDGQFGPGHQCPDKALQVLLVDDEEEKEGGMTRNTLLLEDKGLGKKHMKGRKQRKIFTLCELVPAPTQSSTPALINRPVSPTRLLESSEDAMPYGRMRGGLEGKMLEAARLELLAPPRQPVDADDPWSVPAPSTLGTLEVLMK